MKKFDKNFETSQLEILDELLMSAIKGGKDKFSDDTDDQQDLPPLP